MASKFSLIFCILAIWAIDFTNCDDAPSPSADCTTLVFAMADCLTFVNGSSTITKPEGSCCSGLKNVIKTAPFCLCQAFKNSAQFGIVLNVSKALTLPSVCNVTAAPSVSNCGLSDAPTAAPGVSISPGSTPTAEATGVSPAVHDPSTEPVAAPADKSAAPALLPISVGSLVFLLSVFLGL